MRHVVAAVVALLLSLGSAASSAAVENGLQEPSDPAARTSTDDQLREPLDTSDATLPMRASTAAGTEDPQCMGAKFTRLNGDSKAAAALMTGTLKIPTFPAWKLPSNPTWRENPFSNTNWVFQFQTLRWADPLRRVGIATGNQAMLDRYRQIVRDWVADNPLAAPRSPYSWYDMSVGVRAITLVCLAATVEILPLWMDKAMQVHAAALSDPQRYRTRGNHGLHQNMGLLALGCNRKVRRWRDLAIRRAETMLKGAVDEQGVTDEGSVLYQGLNYRWHLEFRERLVACGVTPSSLFGRVNSMPDFLAYATQPDGNLVAFGDTSAITSATRIPGTTAEYAATLGAEGPKPNRLFSVYRRGYAFSRSGWFDTLRSNEQSLASIRFGQSKNDAVHGHEDAGNLGYFALGRQHLWQPGVYGGGGGLPRRYVLSNEAHNTIDIVGSTYNRNATAPLSVTRSSRTVDLVTIRTKALSGASWQRTMVHVKDPGFLVVDDRVSQNAARRVVQRWQFGTDRKVGTGRSRAGTSGAGSNATLLWVGRQPALSVVRGRLNPPLGWRSETVNQFTPAPTLEASGTGRSVRLTAIIVPRRSNVAPSSIRLVRSQSKGDRRIADVAIGGKRYRVTFSGSKASVRVL